MKVIITVVCVCVDKKRCCDESRALCRLATMAHSQKSPPPRIQM